MRLPDFAAVFAEIKTRAHAATAAATRAAAAAALGDANRYVRYQSGALMRSSLSESVLTEGRLVWKTDYAVRVYYLGRPQTLFNPEASLMWAHKAADLHAPEWHAAAKAAFRDFFDR